jgi:uncharacterized membrane protein HdeD (DUF308 family)
MRPNTSSLNEKAIASACTFSGISLIVIGMIAVAATFLFTVISMMVLAALMIAAGISEFVHAFRTRGTGKILLTVLSGILYLATGMMVLWNPVLGALSLTMLISIFLVAAGAIRCVKAAQLARAKSREWGWILFGGIVDILLGAIIFYGWPISGLWVPAVFVGVDMILNGVALLAMSSVIGENAPTVTTAAV